MSIVVEWRDPRGKVRSRADDPSGWLDRLVAQEPSIETSPMLWSIDPYQDTVFNSRQCEHLAIELRSASGGSEEQLAAMLDLVDRCSRTPHTVIVFVSD